jgi:hypothetical protein
MIDVQVKKLNNIMTLELWLDSKNKPPYCIVEKSCTEYSLQRGDVLLGWYNLRGVNKFVFVLRKNEFFLQEIHNNDTTNIIVSNIIVSIEPLELNITLNDL